MSLEFFIDTKSFQSHCCPGVDSASNRNEYRERFLGSKGGRCIRLTLPPSCAVVVKTGNLNFLEPSGPLRACNGTGLPFTRLDSYSHNVFTGNIRYVFSLCVTCGDDSVTETKVYDAMTSWKFQLFWGMMVYCYDAVPGQGRMVKTIPNGLSTTPFY